jgi:hypothetical protein
MIGPRASLPDLARASQSRLSRLRSLTYDAATLSFNIADRLLTYVVIQAQTEWAEFVRAFLLSCIAGGTQKNGATVTVTVAAARRPSEMMRMAVYIQSRGKSNYVPRRRRDEPSWHSVKLLVPLANKIGLSNETTISGAVSTGSAVFTGLTSVRNFYAHRNDDTRTTALTALQRLAVPRYPHPTLSLLAKPAGSSNPLIVDWLSDLHVAVDLMCQ